MITNKLTDTEAQYFEKVKKLNPFTDIIASINKKSGNLFDDTPDIENQYLPFIINKAYSFGADTILYANEMNLMTHLPNKLQYDFYYYGLEKSPRRRNPWVKEGDTTDIDTIKEYHRCSFKKAKEYLNILTADQIADMKEYVDKLNGKYISK